MAADADLDRITLLLNQQASATCLLGTGLCKRRQMRRSNRLLVLLSRSAAHPADSLQATILPAGPPAAGCQVGPI